MNPEHIVNNLQHAVLLLNSQQQICFCNTAAEVLFSSSANRLKQACLTDILPDLHEQAPQLQHALADGQDFYQEGLGLFNPPKQKLLVQLAASSLSWQDQDYQLLEFKQIETDAYLNQILRQQHDTTTHLLLGLAHEVKNPLVGIKGAAQLLQKQLNKLLPDTDLHEYTDLIVQEADRLKQLVDKLLTQPEPVNKSNVNVHELLEKARRILQIDCPDSIKIIRDYDPSLPVCYAASDQIFQVILNIMQNAIQALAGEGEVILKTRVLSNITLGKLRHKLVVKIDVIDNGPGIKPELQDKIFYPLITDKANGTGMGLSIAQSIMIKHDGLIEFATEPGKTCFSILLPVSNPHE